MGLLPDTGGSWKELLQRELNVRSKRKVTPTILILWVLLFANLIWAVDYLFKSSWRPGEVSEVRTVMVSTRGGGQRATDDIIVYFNEYQVRMNYREVDLLPEDFKIEYRITPITHIITDFRAKDSSGILNEFESIRNLYFPFFFFPLISLIAAVLGLLIIRWLPDEELIEFKFGVLSLIFYLISLFIYRIM